MITYGDEMTLKVRLIPSILFMNGITVKSKRFGQHRNVGSYINAVRVYRAREVDELVFLDISATDEHRVLPNYVVKEIADECNMPLAVGGGIGRVEDITNLLSASADKISINSAVIADPAFLDRAISMFGSANIIVSIDAKKVGSKHIVFSHGGKVDSGMDVVDWAQKVEAIGAGEIFLTSMDTDGMMEGFDIDLIKKVSDNVATPVIASGGAGEPSHFVDAVLKGGASAVSAASIFHFTQYNPRDIKEVMAREGIPVRL